MRKLELNLPSLNIAVGYLLSSSAVSGRRHLLMHLHISDFDCINSILSCRNIHKVSARKFRAKMITMASCKAHKCYITVNKIRNSIQTLVEELIN